MGAGVHIGSDLSSALDNLSFGLLFAHPTAAEVTDTEFRARVHILRSVMTGDRPLTHNEVSRIRDLALINWPLRDVAWITERAERLIATANSGVRHSVWGWKAPSTYIVLNRLADSMNDLKYIHIIRNGLDMAYSQNQNQLRIWGQSILGLDGAITPRNSLKYWRWANEQTLSIGERLGSRFLLVKFEALCSEPKTEVKRILEFAGLATDEALLARLTGLVSTPNTIGRHRRHSLDEFDPDDIKFVNDCQFSD